MAEHGVKIVTAIFFVMYLCLVIGSPKDYILKMGDAREGQIITVIEGSNVTLICEENGADRATWYTSSISDYVAFTYLQNDQCKSQTNNHSSITLGEFGCTESEYSINLNGIEAKYNGTWRCQMTKGQSIIVTHSIYIFIVRDEHPLSATTRTTTTIQMLSRTTSKTVLNSEMTDSRSRDTLKTEGEFTGNSKSSASPFTGSIIYAIAAIGAIIVLVIIVLVVTLLLRARTRSRVEENKPRQQVSPEGTPPGQEDDHNAIDIGGDYAQVSDFSVRYKVVAENPVYETYDKEVSDVKLSDASAPEHMSDVYSVVKKSEAGGEAPKPSDPDGVSDIYSVVQKCPKGQAAED